MSALDCVFVVHDATGAPLAAFTDEAAAQAYAGARARRTVVSTPLVRGAVAVTTVHTRWVEVDDEGVIQAHAHETYGWCAELDGDEGAPPVAEVEHYVDGRRHRLLGVGTDLDQVDRELRRSVRPAPAPDENQTLGKR